MLLCQILTEKFDDKMGCTVMHVWIYDVLVKLNSLSTIYIFQIIIKKQNDLNPFHSIDISSVKYVLCAIPGY